MGAASPLRRGQKETYESGSGVFAWIQRSGRWNSRQDSDGWRELGPLLNSWVQREIETMEEKRRIGTAKMQTGSQCRKGDVNCLLGSSEYHSEGRTITSSTYFDTIMNLRKAIKSTRPGLLTKKGWFFHDNAPAHGAKLIQALLQSPHWDIFSHPPYSPDLAPSDFHLFPGLKGEFGGQRFKIDELKNAVNTIFQNLDARWYSAGIEKLVHRFNKCLDRFGDYVEKW